MMKCCQCDATAKNPTAAYKADWFAQRDGTYYCSEHKPEWVTEFRERRAKAIAGEAKRKVDAERLRVLRPTVLVRRDDLEKAVMFTQRQSAKDNWHQRLEYAVKHQDHECS